MRRLSVFLLTVLSVPFWVPVFLGLVQSASASSLPAQFVVSSKGQFVQGGLVVIRLVPGTQLYLNGLPVAQANNRALVGFGRDGVLEQRFDFSRDRQNARIDIRLDKRNYDIQRINGLPPAMVDPPVEALEKIFRQAILKREARATETLKDWFNSGFTWPVAGRITGVYGSQRFYNGISRRPHYGIDIAAPAKTPVYAPAPGQVTLAEPDMYFEGGLIFIDHGLSLTSAYMHLDSLNVAVGDIVAQGDLIGRVGSTGRSTGPHLDWRMFWGNSRIDPALVAPPFKATQGR